MPSKPCWQPGNSACTTGCCDTVSNLSEKSRATSQELAQRSIEILAVMVSEVIHTAQWYDCIDTCISLFEARLVRGITKKSQIC